jgi:hypothetical protein
MRIPLTITETVAAAPKCGYAAVRLRTSAHPPDPLTSARPDRDTPVWQMGAAADGYARTSGHDGVWNLQFPE